MVIPTYSVIIQNKKTMEAFSKFQPLFMEALNNNRIGVCKWNESGATLDTAVPELGELTNDKDEWRAIIVRYEDDRPMSAFNCDVRNPFDFEVNKTMDEDAFESEVPLIRLTHMLGGIPAPEMKFESEQVYEKHKAPRTIYKPVVDKKRDEAYERVCKKYEFDCKLPSSIVLVTILDGYVGKETIDTAWSDHRESNSSEFWKRNHYPSICRFLVCDFEKKGPVQRNADEFGFWMSVLLLATNVIDSSTLQAYRLYKLNTLFNRSIMSEKFQAAVDRLKSARHVIEKEIKRDIENQLIIEDKLPDYRLEISVPINLPSDEDCSVSPKGFGMFSQGARTDIGVWNNRKKNSEEKLASAVRSAERTLDQTADRMRDNCVFFEDEVSGLDKYQVEDLTRETGDIYREIVDIQGALPTDDVSADPMITKAADNVKEYLKGRVMGSSAVLALALSFLLIIFAQIPGIVNLYANGVGSLTQILIAAAIECAVVLLFAFCTILVQKLRLNGLLKVYNQYIKAAFNRLTENASDYSRYLSDIASHSRGHSYLNLSRRKKHKTENAHYAKYKHIKAINLFLSKLRVWSTAFHLTVDFDSNSIDEDIVVDIALSPTQNSMYTFESGNVYPVAVNNSGIVIDSPFEFADKLEIVREELYDDDEHC